MTNLLKRDSDPFIIATMYLLKNSVRPEKKYHNNRNKIGFGANMPISEFLTTPILDVSTFEELIWEFLDVSIGPVEFLRTLALLPSKIA